MTDVAIVAFAQSPQQRHSTGTTNGVEMLLPVFDELYAATGLTNHDIDFWCSGSSDYLSGRAFSFISALDAIGTFPPVAESHVEADGAWALYEAWLKIKCGDVDTAVVYGFGKSSASNLRRTLALQLDPYTVAPLWPDSISIAALQARLGIEARLWSQRQMAEVAVRNRRNAETNPFAQLSGSPAADDLLAAPYLADPLRRHDCAPITDGASAVLLASVERAGELTAHPAVITGIAHRIESGHLGSRTLTESASAAAAAQAAGAGAGAVEVAELHAPFSHQELILRAALGLGADVEVNPSGGALAGNPMFAAGLSRIGEAARRILTGAAGRTLGHATSGPALQQNLVCVMEAAG